MERAAAAMVDLAAETVVELLETGVATAAGVKVEVATVEAVKAEVVRAEEELDLYLGGKVGDSAEEREVGKGVAEMEVAKEVAVKAEVAAAQCRVDMAEAKEEAMAAGAKVEVVHTRPSRPRKACCARCTPPSTT